MVWTEHHDILFLREILHIQPWVHRHGSVERGQSWDEIAAVLNSLEEPYFKVTSRSVRDRYALLVKKYKAKWSKEDKASGISPDLTEIDEALLDLIERFNESDASRNKEAAEKKSKTEDDLIKAQEIRNTSLETFGESRKRKEEIGEGSQKRSRSSSKDTLSYIKEKSEREFSLRQDELKLKEKELALQAQQAQLSQQTQQAQLLMLRQQSVAMIEMLKTMHSNK